MFKEKKYAGVALESTAFKIAQVQVQNGVTRLVKLDRHNLVKPVGSSKDIFDESRFSNESGPKDEEIFGFDEAETEQETQKEVDFDKLEAQAKEEDPDIFSLGEMNEDHKAQNNVVLLYNILNEIDRDKIRLAANNPAGNTVFQINSDRGYEDFKKQQIAELIEDKLQAIYGEKKSEDHYAYEIREDGALVLASIDEPPVMLNMISEVNDFYRGKLHIEQLYSDEAALVGLFRSNYNPDPTEITALVQFSETNCRIVFLKGSEFFLVSSPITTGTKKHDFLNVVFSKLLFQLDSGEVPEIDRIVIANNSLGDKAVTFFKENFSAIDVEEFQYKDGFLDQGKFDDSTIAPFTTAIALGAAALQKDEQYPKLSLLPEYIKEQQKIFKLQWHGIALLVLIFATLPVTNYFYQQNSAKIESLSNELQQTETRIVQVQPIVDQTNQVSENLSLLVSKLATLDSLSQGSKAWSEKLDILNREMNRIPNSWFTSMSQTQDGAFIEGYTLYRNRIPAIVDFFAEATLLNVNTEEVREKEMHKFSMIVQQFTADTTVYSPEKPNRIKQILNN